MSDDIFRLILSVVVGTWAGVMLGFLFVPDPTSPVAGAVAVAVAALVAIGFYQSDFLRDPSGTGG